MDFEFSFEQQLLRDQSRKLFAESQALESARRHLDGDRNFDKALWDQTVAQGWPAILVAEEQGELSLSALEACVLAEELGRSLAPIPLEGSFLASRFLTDTDSDASAELLGEIAAGATVAWVANNGQLKFANNCVSGDHPHVVSAEHAKYLLVIDSEFAALFAASDLSLSNAPSIDATRPVSAVSFAGAKPLVSSRTNGQELLELAAVLLAFAQLGVAENSLYAARDYANERYAFGRQIGSYQAVKHCLADIYTGLQLARSNCYAAGWALTTEEAVNTSLFIATAKVSSNEACDFAAKESIQLHGGIGFTWEVDRHLFYRRARLYAQQARGRHYWQDQLITHLRRKND